MSTTATRPGVTDLGRKSTSLAIRCQDRPDDPDAWRELLDAMEGIVTLRAFRMATRSGGDEDDMRQDGRMGVVRAVATYRREMGEFSTMAVPWILQRMIVGRIKVAGPVHVPMYARQEVRRWLDAGQPPDAEMERAYAGMLSIRELADRSRDGHGGATLDDLMGVRDDPGPAEVAELADEVGRLRRAVEQLRREDPRAADVLCRCRGIFGHAEETQRAIGDACGLTRSRIKQLYLAAMARVTAILTDPDSIPAPAPPRAYRRFSA